MSKITDEDAVQARTILLVGKNSVLATFLSSLGDVLQLDDSGAPPSDEFIASCKGVVFGGGPDINPDVYDSDEGEHNRTFCGSDVRILFETDVFDACQRTGVPTVGICRGAQFVCAMSGGKLVQHVTGHTAAHKVDVRDLQTGEWRHKYSITSSTHHQMMMPFQMKDDEYEVLAKSSDRKSTLYERGPLASSNYTIEDMPCEPEVVIFGKTNALAIQGHPEYKHTCGELFIRYCEEIIEKHFEVQ